MVLIDIATLVEDANRVAMAQFKARPLSFEWIPGTDFGGVYRHGKLIGRPARDGVGGITVRVNYLGQTLERKMTWVELLRDVSVWCDEVDAAIAPAAAE